MPRRTALPAVAVTLLAFGSAAPVLAQAPLAPSSPVQPQPRDQNMPATGNTVPEKVDSTGAANLSDKLNRSEGVITPPGGVDPGIAVRAPVPNPGTTPVITPPGEPGGNQSVQPK